MTSEKIVQKAIYQTIKRGATQTPEDVTKAFRKSIEKEKTKRAKLAFKDTLESLELSKKRENPACPDTGWPLFFFKVGNNFRVEGGMSNLEEITRLCVKKTTIEGYLRSTMKHPLTGHDPGTNVGLNIPHFSYKFVPGEDLEVTYVAKGGGSECFGGTRYRMVAYADGLPGIQKFVLDAYSDAARAGAICPPGILGVGIGGTADISAELAKKAATLRTIDSSHPEKEISKIEDSLTQAINSLGIGPMGLGGEVSVFSVNVEYSYTHLAGIAVSISSNCWISRRATTKISSNGTIEKLSKPNWFGDR